MRSKFRSLGTSHLDHLTVKRSKWLVPLHSKFRPMGTSHLDHLTVKRSKWLVSMCSKFRSLGTSLLDHLTVKRSKWLASMRSSVSGVMGLHNFAHNLSVFDFCCSLFTCILCSLEVLCLFWFRSCEPFMLNGGFVFVLVSLLRAYSF